MYIHAENRVVTLRSWCAFTVPELQYLEVAVIIPEYLRTGFDRHSTAPPLSPVRQIV